MFTFTMINKKIIPDSKQDVGRRIALSYLSYHSFLCLYIVDKYMFIHFQRSVIAEW